MKCPMCGYSPRRGRPRTLNDRQVQALIRGGWSITATAKHLKVTRMAIYNVLKRSSGSGSK